MARPLRIEYAGAVYHVTSRGNGGAAIFKDDKDRLTLLDILKRVNDRFNWMCHAYCLMDNHYHLVIETPDGNLSKGMRQLNGVYTMRFNKRHRTFGHTFQGRYKAILVQKESYLLEVVRYVALNPVRAKLVRAPEQWRWNSHRSLVGLEQPHPCLTTEWVLAQFGARKRLAVRKYGYFVRDGIGRENIWRNLKAQSLLGDEDFIDRLVDRVRGHEEIKEIPKSQRFINRPSLEEIFRDTEKSKDRRDRKLSQAVVGCGYSQKEVADHLHLHYSTVSRLLKSNPPQESQTSKSKT